MAQCGPESLGEFIRRQRELHELSMRQVAHMAGISNPYLSQIEHGLREPSEKVMEAIARSLEVSAAASTNRPGARRRVRNRGDGGGGGDRTRQAAERAPATGAARCLPRVHRRPIAVGGVD